MIKDSKKRGPFKLLALDVDGTLVEGALTKVSSRVEAAIHGILEHTAVVLCTGRSNFETAHLIDQLRLHGNYRIHGGGALVESPDNTPIWMSQLESAVADTAARLMTGEALRIFSLSDDGWQQHRAGRAAYLVSFLADNQAHIDRMREALQSAHTNVQFSQVSDSDANFPERSNLLLAPIGTSKGSALLSVCSALNIKPEEVVAVGDSHIDISMFEVAGLAVAMGNAPHDVQARAHVVAPSLEQDGVAHVIERYFGKSGRSRII